MNADLRRGAAERAARIVADARQSGVFGPAYLVAHGSLVVAVSGPGAGYTCPDGSRTVLEFLVVDAWVHHVERGGAT